MFPFLNRVLRKALLTQPNHGKITGATDRVPTFYTHGFRRMSAADVTFSLRFLIL